MAYTPQRPRQWHQILIIIIGIALALIVLITPLILIFAKAFSEGWSILVSNLGETYMTSAIKLTLLAAVITVPINLVFGLLLAWCVTRFDFTGKKILLTLIDIPYATSPVVAGLCYLVIYGSESFFGQWLSSHDIQIMFAWPGIILVTLFVTSPYVAKTVIPFMQTKNADEELAALTLGASGWQMFRKITLPNIKWALLYGVIVTNARAVGEFGAVSVVSGTIMNETLTLPLLVDQLNNDYKTAAAFTAAALLASMAIITLILKTVMEWKQKNAYVKAMSLPNSDAKQ